jgi:hypothetical protein
VPAHRCVAAAALARSGGHFSSVTAWSRPSTEDVCHVVKSRVDMCLPLRLSSLYPIPSADISSGDIPSGDIDDEESPRRHVVTATQPTDLPATL